MYCCVGKRVKDEQRDGGFWGGGGGGGTPPGLCFAPWALLWWLCTLWWSSHGRAVLLKRDTCLVEGPDTIALSLEATKIKLWVVSLFCPKGWGKGGGWKG